MRENNKIKSLYTVARSSTLVAGIFAILLSALMIVNYIQIKKAEPLKSKAIDQLMLKFRANQEDGALKEQIRALDLLARKAYFTNQWQIRTGGFLLFAFALAFLIALKYMSSLQAQLPDLNEELNFEKSWENKLLARRYLVFGGVGLFAAAFFAGILAENEFLGIAGKENKKENKASVFPSLEEIKNNWPNFRGPGGIGIASDTSAPTRWDGKSGENILWKTEIPLNGNNSPIVWGKNIFFSGADQRTQVVFCFDTEKGSMLWQKELNNIPGSPEKKPKNKDEAGYAASTMATDGTRIFVIFGTGDIACLDFKGNQIWAKNLGVPDNHYGHSSSLITYQDLLVVQYDQNAGGHLIALKTETGNLVYDQIRDSGISWASPILVNTGNRFEVILNSNPNVISYDPATGQELWKVNCMSGEVTPSPAYADGMVFAINEYAKLAAIKLGGTPAVVWESTDNLAEVSSPLATKDYLFVATSYGTISCFESKTGQRYWFQDLDNGFYSSPVLVGDNVYAMDMTGVMYIFKAEKEFKLVNKCELGEQAVTIPVYLHGRIYIRGLKNLYCIAEKK